MKQKEEIRKTVRRTYGNIAVQGSNGFENITITPKKISQELINEILPGSLAGEYVVSANIQAQKPFSAI